VSARGRAGTLAMLAVYAAITAAATGAALNMEPFGVLVRDGRVDGLQDFASHRGFACAVWSGDAAKAGGTSAYTLPAHLEATERWSGISPRIALPFGYSPTMTWILGPLCLLPTRAAFVAWIAAGLVCTAAAALWSRTHWWTLVALLNPVTIYAIVLGQTAILSTAAFLYLIAADRAADAASWGTVVVLWLLTAKPPLAVTAAVALLVRGRWRPVALAVGLTAVSTLLVWPWLGAGWVHDYLAMLRDYDRVHLPAAFAWSIVPESMSNLRAFLSADLGVPDDVAASVANVLWIASLVALLVAGRWRELDGGLVWSLALLAYLLLCPHVSATEDLTLVCVLVALERRLPVALALVALALVFGGLHLSPALGIAAHRRPSLLFFAKVALLGVVVAGARKKRDEAPAQTAAATA
jgi:hypothetical protein